MLADIAKKNCARGGYIKSCDIPKGVFINLFEFSPGTMQLSNTELAPQCSHVAPEKDTLGHTSVNIGINEHVSGDGDERHDDDLPCDCDCDGDCAAYWARQPNLTPQAL